MEKEIRTGFRPTHPGEVLKDEIEYRKISQRKLAEGMGISYKVLNDLLNGRRTFTLTTVLSFLKIRKHFSRNRIHRKQTYPFISTGTNPLPYRKR